MMCLLFPRGITREEVVNICVSNFLLREGLIVHGLEQLIPYRACLAMDNRVRGKGIGNVRAAPYALYGISANPLNLCGLRAATISPTVDALVYV